MTISPKTVTAGAALSLGLLLSACGGGSTATPTKDDDSAVETMATARFELVSANDAQSILDAPPDGLVVLDVRTPEEFAEGHVANAILVDFYEPDFADRLGELDRDVPYVLYCRSGNRSAETSEMMRQLGFTEVHEIDGGLSSWISAGLSLES